MKAGDKVYCYKEVRAGEHVHCIKGKWYYIDSIKENSVIIKTEKIGLMGFNLKKDPPYAYRFYDFFITQKDLRRLKLKVIENGRSE